MSGTILGRGNLLAGDEAVGDAVGDRVADEDARTAGDSCPDGGRPIAACESLACTRSGVRHAY